MSQFFDQTRPIFAKFLILASFALAACSQQLDSANTVNDPIEPVNRAVHQVNKGLDRVILRPASQVYGAVTPEPIDIALQNTVSNLSLPSDVVNHTLQGDLGAAFKMSGRFLINSTVGILGIFDPASQLDLPDDSTDFGETLYVWGAGEGAYIELPLFGPSTLRDGFGRIVDLTINPVGNLLPESEQEVVTVLRGLDLVGNRHRLGVVIDGVLYASEDSYTAAQIGYLQNRRNALRGGELNEADLDDPFAFDP